MRKWSISSFIVASLCATPVAFASMPAKDLQTVIAPTCLLEHASGHYQELASIKDFRLVQAQPIELAQLVMNAPKGKEACGKYWNVSDKWAAFQKSSTQLTQAQNQEQFLQRTLSKQQAQAKPSVAKQYKIEHQDVVNAMLATVQADSYWTNLQQLSDTDTFPDRSAYSDDGVAAAKWLQQKVLSYAKAGNRTDVSTRFVATGGNYVQPSLVVKIGEQTGPGIVVGAHMDTLDNDWWDGYKPGADDDGSGTVTVMELARVLLSSKQRFNKPIYLMWYAAEERGLVGSGKVVDDFAERNIPVEAVLHFDMTGYQNQGDADKVWLIMDNVNEPLSAFVTKLATTYTGAKTVGTSKCGYACSDHASWTAGGIPSAMPTESSFHEMNQDIHSSRDTMAHLSKDHMLKYAKLAVAFVGELADPVG